MSSQSHPHPISATLPALPGRVCQTGTAMTIGVFDGIHLGHQELLRRIQVLGARHGLVPVLMTFAQHPLSLLAPAYAPTPIQRPQRKSQILQAAGIHHTITIDFQHAFASLPPEDFFHQILVKHYGLRHLVCGTDFRFGRGGYGDVALLRQLAQPHGIPIEIVDDIIHDGITVRSTAIREAILGGQVEQAAAMLSRPHELVGKVVRGLARGRAIGFPTANLQPTEDLVIPMRGVYLTAVRIINDSIPQASNQLYPAMTNIGFNPTFGLERLSIETHLLQFDGDLVDQTLEVTFLARLRDEQKFSGVEALRAQLEQDRQTCQTLLESPFITDMLSRVPPGLPPSVTPPELNSSPQSA